MKFSFFIIFSLMTLNFSAAAETLKEKSREVANDTKRATKQAGHDLEDKTCELVHGKMECAVKKVKHSAQKKSDKIEDSLD